MIECFLQLYIVNDSDLGFYQCEWSNFLFQICFTTYLLSKAACLYAQCHDLTCFILLLPMPPRSRLRPRTCPRPLCVFDAALCALAHDTTLSHAPTHMLTFFTSTLPRPTSIVMTPAHIQLIALVYDRGPQPLLRETGRVRGNYGGWHRSGMVPFKLLERGSARGAVGSASPARL